MIRIGPAGIPLSCKGRTLKDGIIYTKSLELDALEVQFVRGIRMSVEDALEVREVAEAADVELHVHAPYYTNLAGDERNLALSREKILKAGEMANAMGARTVVVHPGFYGELSPPAAQERIVEVVGALRDEYRANKWTPKIGLVTMGKRAVFGSLDEIINVCKEVEGVRPVIDFAHIHARGNGSLNTVEDFQEVFDALIPLAMDTHLIHFTGVRYENGNERHHLPIKKGDLRFEPLVEVILENEYNVTLISTSPILEHDAMYMQIVLDRVKEKREQRVKRDEERRLKELEEAASGATSGPKEPAEAEVPAEKPKEKPKEVPKPEPRPQCAAITQAGTPCSNPARTGSKYCSSHRGYRPNRAPAAPQKPAKKAAAPKPAKKAAKAPASKKATRTTASGTSRKRTPATKADGETPAKKPAAKKQAAKRTATKPTKTAPAGAGSKGALSAPGAAAENMNGQDKGRGVKDRLKAAARRIVGKKEN
jgi:deoxyribonuclease IV